MSEQSRSPKGDDDLPIPLEPEVPRPAPRPPVITQPKGPAPSKCPKCGYSLAGLHEPKRCPECGVNFESFKKASAKVAPVSSPSAPQAPTGGLKCPGCGYALAGLQDPKKCPECGEAIDAAKLDREARRDARLAEAALQGRREYIKPPLMILGGLAVVAIAAVIRGEGSNIPFLLLRFIVELPVSLAVFFLCALIWMGLDAPWGLTSLRIAGIYALSWAAWDIISPIPIIILNWVVPLAIYVDLLMRILDLELRDALLVAVLTYLVKILIFVVLLGALVFGP